MGRSKFLPLWILLFFVFSILLYGLGYFQGSFKKISLEDHRLKLQQQQESYIEQYNQLHDIYEQKLRE